MIFLSLPYSHQYKEVIDYRIKIASIYAGHLMREGLIPVSPIIFGSKMLEHVNLPSDFDTWDKLCYAYLDNCKEIHILCIDGWNQSKGVAGEIDHAIKNGIEIKFINTYKHDDGKYYFTVDKEATNKFLHSRRMIKIQKNKK